MPVVGQRVNGFLYCKKCRRSWAFFGTDDKTAWPQHRCGWDVSVFQEFLLEDPNTKRLPKGKGSKLAHDD